MDHKQDHEFTETEIDAACRRLEQVIKDADRDPVVAAIISKQDQIRAECRENPESRDAAIELMIGQGVDRHDAEEWIDRGVGDDNADDLDI